MLNGKTQSVQYIIEKVFRDTGIVEGVDLYDAIEWTAEVIELIGVPQTYQPKIACIEIKDGRGDLPCDLHLIMQSRVKTDEGYSAMRYSTDNFHRYCGECKDNCVDCSTTYTVSDSCIFPNFQDGTIEMAYKAIATDDNGWPSIPDDIKFVKAVEYYIREKIDYKLWRVQKIPQAVYEKTLQDQLWYLGAAQTRGVMPSPDQMENLKNNWIRLIPKINQHQDFFATLGEPERRIAHNSRGIGPVANRSVDSNDYFDYLDDQII